RAIRREGDPLDLPQARAHLGDGDTQTRKGRDPLPGREPLTSSRERERACDVDAVVGLGLDGQLAPERLDAVTQPAEGGTGAVLQTDAFCNNSEDDCSLSVVHSNRDPRRVACALEYLETAEVHRASDLGWVARAPGYVEMRSHAGTHCRRAQRRGQPARFEQG